MSEFSRVVTEYLNTVDVVGEEVDVQPLINESSVYGEHPTSFFSYLGVVRESVQVQCLSFPQLAEARRSAIFVSEKNAYQVAFRRGGKWVA